MLQQKERLLQLMVIVPMLLPANAFDAQALKAVKAFQKDVQSSVSQAWFHVVHERRCVWLELEALELRHTSHNVLTICSSECKLCRDLQALQLV